MEMVVFENFVTPAGAGRILDLTPCRVRQLIDEGRLPALKTPLGRLLSRADVTQFAEQRHAKQATR